MGVYWDGSHRFQKNCMLLLGTDEQIFCRGDFCRKREFKRLSNLEGIIDKGQA